MLFRIAAVNELTGEPAEDQRARERVGREGHLMQLEPGKPMILYYDDPDSGEALVTSKVKKVFWRRRGESPLVKSMGVVTRNHVYILKSLEG